MSAACVQERVEKAGGQVLYWNGHRVMGVLAMSRAIGDHCLRPYVIPEPEVCHVPVCIPLPCPLPPPLASMAPYHPRTQPVRVWGCCRCRYTCCCSCCCIGAAF